MTTRTLNSDHPIQETAFLSHLGFKQTYPVNDLICLGRDPNNQVVLSDDFISARHARIERTLTGYVLRDLRSRNGTYLNGNQVLEAHLNDGDRIRIGLCEFVFSYNPPGAGNIIELTSKNPAWQKQLAKLPSISDSTFPVLISGPSGTGKDLIAQAIHRLSMRRRSPLVCVNCSAFSDSLVESELFGHVRGSFTGATTDRKGAFEAARGGTLFLDEIGDLPLHLQPKLLRALENQQIRPVGSDRAISTDVRIVAATHHDLKRLVFEGRFRSDLYFRLHVIQLHAPPLRQRMEDFDDLLYFFCRQMRVGFSFEAIQELKKHSWPGNIRELRNFVVRAKTRDYNRQIEIDDLKDLLDFVVMESPERKRTRRAQSNVLKELEFEMIRDRLIANHGNQRRTAIELGIARSTLNDRIRSYGIDVDQLIRSRF